LADDIGVETEVRKWLREQSKYFYAVGFSALVKRWDRCINVDESYVENEVFSTALNITCFTFILICDLFADTSS
jgi:hypothetical protein